MDSIVCIFFLDLRKSKRLHSVEQLGLLFDFVGMSFQPICGINSGEESVLDSFLRLVSFLPVAYHQLNYLEFH